MYDNINEHSLNIKTEQAAAFRILIEALKEILTEATLFLMNQVLN